MKTFKFFFITLTIIFSMVSCTQGESPKNTSASSKPKVAFICKSYADTFCVWVKNEVEKKAADYANSFSVESFDSKNNSSTQIEQIENCIAIGYDVIIFQQVDAEAPVAAVKKAVEKGIKVIVTTGSINDDGESVYIDADPVQQGRALAEYAVKHLPENAKIAILQGPAGNFHANGREEGFNEILKTRPDIEVVAEDIAEWKKDKTLNIVQNWLVSLELDGILAHNDDMALGAIEAIKMSGIKKDFQVYGIDATAGGCKAVKDNLLMATVFQNAVTYAHQSLEYAEKALKGEKIESVRIDSELVTPDNVDTYIQIHKDLGNY